MEEVTVNVTGTVTELVLEVTLTEAVYVPTARLPGLTDTPIELGVLPLLRFTESQDAPEVESLKLMLPLLLLTDRFCEAGALPPCWKPNAIEVGLTRRLPPLVVEVILSVTGTVTDPEYEEMVTEAL